jgi:hypothetical protein
MMFTEKRREERIGSTCVDLDIQYVDEMKSVSLVLSVEEVTS